MRVFISYRHVKPDEDLARALFRRLKQLTPHVFIDSEIQTGMDWVEETVRQIQQASHFVVLLSAESIQSDMVRKEIKLAREQRQKGRLQVFPVRVAFEGELPYDLGSFLDRIQYDTWRPPEPHESLADRLAGVLAAARAPLPLEDPAGWPEARQADEFRDRTGAPLPAADPRTVVFMETGAVRVNSPFYIRRPEDDAAESAIRERGTTVVIKGTRQSGKSSLLARVRALARRDELRLAYIDLQELDETHLQTLNALLRTLAQRLGKQLGAAIQPGDVWDEDEGPKSSIKRFLEQGVLKHAQQPVIVCLDEVDRVFDCAFRDEFFLALRGWHNERALSEPWEMLNLFLAHATDPVLWIQNLNTSPFNVGERLRLADFDLAALRELNARYGNPAKTDREIEQLHSLTGGKPYLARRTLYVLARQNWSLEKLDTVALDERGPFGDHLRALLWSLHRANGLRAALAEILRSGRCEAEMDFQRLLAAGLVTGHSHTAARLSCELYRRYLEERL